MPEIFVSDEIPFMNLNLSRISAETKISDLSEISAEILLRLETFHESGPRTGDSCTTLRVKDSLEITLSLTVFEILILFPRKSKMAAKSGENRTFSPLHRTLLYHPVGQKFARNRSISYGFRDIDTFSFSAESGKN